MPESAQPHPHTDRTHPVVRAMQFGQYVIGTVLITLGMIRAIGCASSPWPAILAGAALAAWLFSGLIVANISTQSRATRIWFVVGCVVWLGAVVVSPDFVWLGFLMWLLCGHLLPLGPALITALGILTVIITAPLMHHGTTSVANIVGPAVGGVFAFGISRGYLELLREAERREATLEALERARAETENLQDELALSQRRSGELAERERIARDIHDTVAQSLSSMQLFAHAAAGTTKDPDNKRGFEQLATLASEGLTDVRRIIAELSPAELDDGALAEALNRMLQRLSSQTGIEYALEVDSTLPTLAPTTEVTLLRAAQSILANVRTHARASHVTVNLIDEGDIVRLDVIDDGIGFNPAGLRAGPASYGLKFLRNRLRELGGDLAVESAIAEGTACSVHLPIHAMPEPTSQPLEDER